MTNLPDDNPSWMQIADLDGLQEVPLHLAGDPYFLQDAPTVPTNFSEEEDPSEDEEEYEGMPDDA